ncbi:MAG: bifunctional phosphopantothenoylcysteine decarboxylase/phosphopantothenate--cysteine ligase CoaBC [Candidatus Atribacteria bacterium]|nr:bifunctional phosphopantothenoylcysteine decarboxylase/phosphopantothenate--cysteine ligase CoaBC [Candidatus Atribacteria bacterium]
MEQRKKKIENILIGITGGIAAYKSPELIRLLRKEKFNVKVILTKNAEHFVAPLTLAVLSENKVYTDLFSQNKEDEEISHISLAHWADLILVAPATANIIAKVAHGLADDLLTATILAFPGEIILAPAMNTVMFNNPIYQENSKRLIRMGFQIIDTEQGLLACGDYGDGRMASPETICTYIIQRLHHNQSLKDKKILITASATREPIDQIRFISNYSTGKMGFALAEVARNRGGSVTLITGPTYLKDISGVKMIRVNTAQEMREQVLKYFNHSDIFISAAAVSDFKPAQHFPGKIKKTSQQSIQLVLEKNIDILEEVGMKKNNQILIGFAAEVNSLEENALLKLKSKNLDYIIANDVSQKDSGFGADTNKVVIIDRTGNKLDLPLMTKHAVSEHIFDHLQKSFRKHHDRDMIE